MSTDFTSVQDVLHRIFVFAKYSCQGASSTFYTQFGFQISFLPRLRRISNDSLLDDD